MTTIKEIEQQFNDNAEFLVGLYERWLDEHGYEDINEYKKAIQQVIPSAYAMTKRPFGFKASAYEGDVHYQFRIKGNRIQVGVARC